MIAITKFGLLFSYCRSSRPRPELHSHEHNPAFVSTGVCRRLKRGSAATLRHGGARHAIAQTEGQSLGRHPHLCSARPASRDWIRGRGVRRQRQRKEPGCCAQGDDAKCQTSRQSERCVTSSPADPCVSV
ncbi:hypothetical protein TNCV_1446141 [Trichonephila clavipes]|nr:hypothetical protein TNCV_1446141 [Trichonephila clavipes]